MEWYIIEMPKLRIPQNLDNLDELSLWTTFIKESGENKELIKMLATKNEDLQVAYEELEKISADKQKRLKYEACQKALYDYNTLIYESKQKGLKESLDIYIRKLKKLNISIDDIIQSASEDFGISINKAYIENL